MLEEADNIRNLAKRAQDPESGTVRLGLFPTLAPYLLPHVVPHIHDRFPNLELLLVEEKTEEILRRLRDGRLDVGVLALPADESACTARTCSARTSCWPCRPTIPCRDRRHRRRRRARHPSTCCCWRRATAFVTRRWRCASSPVPPSTAASAATSLETLRQMVAAGVGITLLPQLAVQPPVAASPDIVLLRFGEPVPRRELGMFWRPTSVYADFLPTLAAQMRDLPEGLLRAGVTPA